MGTITWHRDEPLALVFKPVGDPLGGATAQVLVALLHKSCEGFIS